MAKVIIYPTNSLILSDLVQRFGHTPIAMMEKIKEKISTVGVDSPPLNITAEEPKTGLKYAAVEVPAGVRGRMALVGPMIEQAEAGIIVGETPMAFGCMGCARTNELTKFLIRERDMPVLELDFPESDDGGQEFVYKIGEFLKSLPKNEKEGQQNE
ncbi:methanogenesis marker 5 protein [Methanolobus sp. ZRKC4]|uniref:methanogenesis marker 5 protein n=1 Tax=Methanolobus sp. ZRKC4 TaxID=3125787 RepID=UPI00324C3D1B